MYSKWTSIKYLNINGQKKKKLMIVYKDFCRSFNVDKSFHSQLTDL